MFQIGTPPNSLCHDMDSKTLKKHDNLVENPSSLLHLDRFSPENCVQFDQINRQFDHLHQTGAASSVIIQGKTKPFFTDTLCHRFPGPQFRKTRILTDLQNHPFRLYPGALKGANQIVCQIRVRQNLPSNIRAQDQLGIVFQHSQAAVHDHRRKMNPHS